MKKRRNFIKLGILGTIGMFIKPYKAEALLPFLIAATEFVGVNLLRMTARTAIKKGIRYGIKKILKTTTKKIVKKESRSRAKKIASASAISSFAMDLTADEIENRIFKLTLEDVVEKLNYPKDKYEALWIIDENNILNSDKLSKQHTTIDYLVKNPTNKTVQDLLRFAIIEKATNETQVVKNIPIELQPKAHAELPATFSSSDLKKTGVMQCVAIDRNNKIVKKTSLIIVEKAENLKEIVL